LTTQLQQIQSALRAHGLRPKHRLGQNFLHDASKLALVLRAGELEPEDLVLEVGPGTGVLTRGLLEAGARVLAVEVDRDLEPVLREVIGGAGGRAGLIIADVLDGKHAVRAEVYEGLRELARGRAQARGLSGEGAGPGLPSFKLVANLPYHVASPLLANLASQAPSMSLAVAMVQREVADRLAAQPGGGDYGPLSVLIQSQCEVERLAVLPPGCFWPAPGVASAVARLRRRATPLTDRPDLLSAALHRVFSQRRKQLGRVLAPERAAGLSLPPGAAWDWRPERLSVPQWCELAQSLAAMGGGSPRAGSPGL
jgi:16S rRNA (adenine1518-N6/adenine1519-N6)-dimethyltransferase